MGAKTDTFGPVQLRNALGLQQWEVQRALDEGLLEPAGPDGRWPGNVVRATLARISQIKEKIGDLQDLGGWRAAEELAERLGVEVDRDAVIELARAGRIKKLGFYKGEQLYCGRSLAAFRDPAAFREATLVGRRLTTQIAATYMDLRRRDFDHLVRAGRVKRVGWYWGQWSSVVNLYRTGDLDDLLADPSYDWPAIRATPKGKASALAQLPDGTVTGR